MDKRSTVGARVPDRSRRRRTRSRIRRPDARLAARSTGGVRCTQEPRRRSAILRRARSKRPPAFSTSHRQPSIASGGRLAPGCTPSSRMDPERWRKVTEIFHAAPARESAPARHFSPTCAVTTPRCAAMWRRCWRATPARGTAAIRPRRPRPASRPARRPGLHRIESAMAPAVPPGRSDPARPSIAAAAHCSASSICAPRKRFALPRESRLWN